MALFDAKKDVPVNPVNPAVAECDRQIADIERRRYDLIVAIGNKYIELNTFESSVGTPYEYFMRELQELLASRAMLETRKLAIQGLRRCEKCGNILVLDSLFCNKCGEKLEPIAQPGIPMMQPVQQSPCPVCGKPCEPGAVFCTSCGAKLNG